MAQVDTRQPFESIGEPADMIKDDVHAADDATYHPLDMLQNKILTNDPCKEIENDDAVPSETRTQSFVQRISSTSPRRGSVCDKSLQVDPVIELADMLQNADTDAENGDTQTNDDQLGRQKEHRLSFLRRVGVNLFGVEKSDRQSVPNRQKPSSWQRRRSDVVVVRRNQRDFDVPDSSTPEIKSMPLLRLSTQVHIHSQVRKSSFRQSYDVR